MNCEGHATNDDDDDDAGGENNDKKYTNAAAFLKWLCNGLLVSMHASHWHTQLLSQLLPCVHLHNTYFLPEAIFKYTHQGCNTG